MNAHFDTWWEIDTAFITCFLKCHCGFNCYFLKSQNIMKTQQIYASYNCTLVLEPPYPSPGRTLSSYYCSSPLSPSSLVSSNNFKINYNQHVELYCDTTIMHHLVLPPYRVPSYTIIVTSWFVLDLFHIASLLASLCGVFLFVIHMQQSHDSIAIFFCHMFHARYHHKFIITFSKKTRHTNWIVSRLF
jgi:hypothetical protein